MGAWGAGIYDNDDAADWVAELTADGTAAIKRTLEGALGTPYLEAPDGACALAAADVVARLVSSGAGEASTYCEDVVTWVAANPGAASAELLDRSLAVVVRVQSEGSELHELWWEDEESLGLWRASLADIELRLRAGR